jgi:hypothetical protein
MALCPGPGAAFFTLHRRAGIYTAKIMGPGSAAQHAAKSGALRSIRGTRQPVQALTESASPIIIPQ